MADAAAIARKVFGDAEWSVEPIVGKGQVNHVFGVRSPAGDAVVRLRAEDGAEAEYRKEAWCIARAAGQGIPGPDVLAVGRHGDVAYMVESLVPGKNGEECALDRSAIWRCLGQYARAIHAIPVTGFGEELADPDRGLFRAPLHDGFDGTWQGFVDYNIEALKDEEDPLIRLGVLTPAESRAARVLLQGLLGRTWRFGLVHGDLHPRNTVVDGDGTIALLDWGSARVDMVPHGEIVQLLRGGIDAAGLRGFLTGYGLRIEEEVRAEVGAHLLLRVLDTCRWALDRCPSLVPHHAEAVRRVAARVLPGV